MNEDRQLLGPLSVSILKGQAVGKDAPAGSVNWSADRWFTESAAADLTDEFKAWWIEYYGYPHEYDGDEDEQHEYWTRCAFALRGWLAARTHNAALTDAGGVPSNGVVEDDAPPETEACGKPSPMCCGCVSLNSPECPRMQTANTHKQTVESVMGRSGDPLVVDGHIVRLPGKTNIALSGANGATAE